MACNVCGGTIDFCDNGDCLTELEGSEFYCHESSHFCSMLCWEKWIADEERSNVEKAEDDKEAEDEG